MRFSPILLVVAGCTASQASADRNALISVVGKRVAGQPQRCVPILSPRNALQAIDNRTLFYRSGRTIWINRLPDDCPRLGPNSRMAVNIIGNRYCRGNSVHLFEPGSTTPVTVCALGDFTPYR